MPILLATSSASSSVVRRTYAFLLPSGLTRVLTLAVLISYMRRTASVICRLFARVSTMKTRVLLSSIFFMADSVVNGNFRIWYWSSLLTRGTERRRYLGLRSRRSVFGLWNFGFKYTLVDFFALSAGALALGAMVPGLLRRLRTPC